MISTKGRYAIRFLIDLAEQNNQPVNLSSIAKRQEISKKYLEQIAKILVSNNLIKGISGKGGGYQLTKKPEEYNIKDILLVTEKTLAPVKCLETKVNVCNRKDFCKTLPMWEEYYQLTNNYFSNLTIADLAKIPNS